MVQPIRIQRSRAKGSKVVSPNGLENVYITRTSNNDLFLCGNMLANPFIIGKPINPSLRICTTISDYNEYQNKSIDLEGSLRMYKHYLKVLLKIYPKEFEAIKQKVRGKNVVCWCKLDQQCHGDILLKLFND